MPYLIESNAWRLLQGLAQLLSRRKSKYQSQPFPLSVNRGMGQSYAGLLEVELRRVLTVKEYPHNLSPTEFEHCQSKLSLLCSLLNDFTIHPGSFDNGPEAQSYPRLLDLARFLESTTEEVDLVAGPRTTIFRLPQNTTELKRCLDVATACNGLLTRLWESLPQEPPILSVPTQNRNAWKKGRIRNRVIFALKGPNEHSALPDSQLVLSPCRGLDLWQEARCNSMNLLFGAWTNTASLGSGKSRQSLDQLILKGAFRPLGLNSLFNDERSARLSLADRRALAVKLGFCLMDFFDVDITANRIYFVNSSTQDPKQDVPYLAFGSTLPAAAGSYDNFKIGHPVLLSFAKLLLEIDFGQIINLDIKPHNNQNRDVWAELFSRVELLAQERSDSYLQAIRVCLVVHEKIAEALRSHNSQSKETADSTIRKKLYKEVIRKLELGLAEAHQKSSRKRQRPESPAPSDPQNAMQAVGLGEMPIRSTVSKPATSDYKRRRVPGAQDSPSLNIPDPSRGEPSNSYEEFSAVSGSDGCLHHRVGLPYSQNDRHGAKEFEIAIICALSLEYNAVSYLFDEFWDDDGDPYGRAPGDPNNYTTGRIGKYNVVLALQPHMGKTNATGAAASMRSSYSSLWLVLVVGVCGAAPYSGDDEILLGDVIITKTVVQYDFGRQYPGRFQRKETIDDSLGKPDKNVRGLVAMFETDRGIDWLEKRTAFFLQQLQDKVADTKRRGRYNHPGVSKDKLFKAEYRHKHYKTASCVCHSCIDDADPVCEKALHLSCAELGCDEEQLVPRDRLRYVRRRSICDGRSGEGNPAVVHIGAVASGDGAIAFEMEGAGVWDEVPSLVVKGVCDYADSHKNKGWQNFAAATAASTCKAVLERYIQTDRPTGV
ncbi:hypothetical protein HJFPF1_07844 [Paramyrothecium foliicola]|nr:hypothetical protein HJFPF1_07844 [Paramyrothecium foliicola]